VEAPTTTGESTTASDTAAKPTGDPIKIGSICSCSGVQASVLGAAGVAIEAWAKNVNAKGGLNGHPVELFLEDDAGDPAKSQQAAKKLVEQDKVVAIVSDYSLVDESWEKYVTEKGVPVVGGLMVETTFLTNPNFFATGAQPPTSLLALTEALEQKGNSSLRVLYCAESPICALSEKLAQLAASAAGGKVEVSGAKVSSTAPDYTAPCLDAKNAGIEAVLLGVNSLVMSRIMNSCIQQSYTPTVTATTEGSGISFAEGTGFEGGLTSGPTAYFTDEDIAGTAEFREAMEASKPGYLESSTMSDNAVEAWAAGKLFEAAAEAANLGPTSTLPTSSRVSTS
jgi:branched-chain amino acid transport system substrate-binding protein